MKRHTNLLKGNPYLNEQGKEERIPTPMPVLFIEGPAGLNATSKRALVKKTVAAMFAAYQMPDDRVYIREYTIENGGHTALNVQDRHHLHNPYPAKPLLPLLSPPPLPSLPK